MRLLLFIIAAMFAAQSASAQSLWRNFFTTNRNPIVEVVAGSNATVQASTVGVNLRRFTVNAVPGSSGFASNVFGTNVIGAVAEATHATNADLATYSTNSGYATNAGTAASGWPTNWPLASITNANHLTNWALVPTNYVPLEAQHATNADFAVYATNSGFATNASNATNAEFVTTATLTNQIYASNVVSGGQITVTALASNTPSASQVLTATSATSAAWQNRVVRSVGISVDGGGSAITAGTKGYISVPYAGTIQSCTLMASPSGSIEFRLWRTNSADGSFPPTAVGAIGTNSLSSDAYNVDSTLTGWTTSLAAGDVLAFNIPATATTITNCTLQLKIQP